MSGAQKYKVVYSVDHYPEGLTADEIRARFSDPKGGCDYLIVHSIILPPDGSRSELICGVNGATGKFGPVDSNELFKSWFITALQLMDSKDLNPEKRRVCQLTVECIETVVMSEPCENPECVTHNRRRKNGANGTSNAEEIDEGEIMENAQIENELAKGRPN